MVFIFQLLLFNGELEEIQKQCSLYSVEKLGYWIILYLFFFWER